jgi:hypothetical protein
LTDERHGRVERGATRDECARPGSDLQADDGLAGLSDDPAGDDTQLPESNRDAAATLAGAEDNGLAE